MKASFISYNQWVNEAITPTVNKHMTHAEDLVILKGVEGLKWVINMFTDLYDILQGHTKKENVKLSIKFDGAPAVFVWSNFPGLNRSGVAVKGLFAKDRKIMFTNEDIDKFYEDKPELAIKLKYMLKFVPKLKIPKGQIWQGDFLFDETTLFEDKEYYSFHPNTIVYKINKNSEMGKKIGDAKIGVVWHTRYTGESLDKIQANYNVKIAELNQIPQVFMTDPYIPSFAGIVTFTEEESEYFKQFIEKIDKTSKTLIFNPEYQKILDNNEFVSLFTIFQNSLIKNNIRVDSPAVFIDKFKEFLINRFQKEINVKKSENSKAILVEKLSNFINLIENNKVVYNITSLILEITKVKHMFIEKLNNIGKFETFLQTRSKKYITTGDEGFAVSDMHGNIVKLVDRYEFSYANFSPNILKGWTK
jgi:hypothetical protein